MVWFVVNLVALALTLAVLALTPDDTALEFVE